MLQITLVLANDGLEQPDGIGCSITGLEGLLPWVKWEIDFKLLSQDPVKASDDDVRNSDWPVLRRVSGPQLCSVVVYVIKQ